MIYLAWAALAAVIILFVTCPLKAEIRQDNLRVHLGIRFLFIHIRREYEIRPDSGGYLALYELKKKEEKKVTTLRKLLAKDKGEASEVSLVNLLKIVGQNRREGKERKAFSYLNKKSRFDVGIMAAIGIGDAYYTALLCGWVAAVGNAFCAAYTRGNKHFRISVKPEFNRLSFSLQTNCIIAITLANIILGYFIYKMKTRGKENASNREHHANCDVQN